MANKPELREGMHVQPVIETVPARIEDLPDGITALIVINGVERKCTVESASVLDGVPTIYAEHAE